MRVILALALLVGFQTVNLAQSGEVELKKAQKALKNVLIKDAPWIYSVKFDGCRMSLRSGTETYWSPSSSSSSEAGRTGYFSDEGRFTGGPDKLVFGRSLDNYSIDLRALDAAKIKTTVYARNKSQTLFDLPNSDGRIVTAITPNDTRERFAHDIYRIAVKTKSVDKLQNAFRNIAGICSKQN